MLRFLELSLFKAPNVLKRDQMWNYNIQKVAKLLTVRQVSEV